MSGIKQRERMSFVAATAVMVTCVPLCLAKPPGGKGNGGGNEPTYTITAFEPFGSDSPSTWVFDVNEFGTAAVGAAQLANGDDQYAHLDLTTGVYAPFPVGFQVNAVNNHQQLVGSVDTSAVYWNDMTVAPVTLPPLPGDTWSAAWQINDAGVILGESGGDNGPEAGVLWRVSDQGQGGLDVDGPYALPPILTGEITSGRNLDELVDGVGHVVGRSGGMGAVWTVALDDNDQLLAPELPEPLGTLNGATPTWSEGFGINQGGDIAGQSDGLPVLVTSGQPMVALPMPRKTNYGVAKDVNDVGAIVGDLHTPDPFHSGLPSNFDAYLWQDGQPVLLESLIGKNSGWDQLLFADEITNSEIIAGHGYLDSRQERGFLMMPTVSSGFAGVPEPSSLTLIALVCAGLLMRRRFVRATKGREYNVSVAERVGPW